MNSQRILILVMFCFFIVTSTHGQAIKLEVQKSNLTTPKNIEFTKKMKGAVINCNKLSTETGKIKNSTIQASMIELTGDATIKNTKISCKDFVLHEETKITIRGQVIVECENFSMEGTSNPKSITLKYPKLIWPFRTHALKITCKQCMDDNSEIKIEGGRKFDTSVEKKK